GLAIEAGATYLDPFGALLSNGLGWAMEYFEPLRKVLDELTGMPDVVKAQAATWHNMARELSLMCTQLQSNLDGDTPGWIGDAKSSYRGLMVNNVDGLGGLSAICTAMGLATEGAGGLVELTRGFVRDFIADCVGRVVVWALEALLAVTIPVVAAQIAAAVVKWAARIYTWVTALINSLTNLSKLLNG
ncbi:MAG: hypothetical protein QOF58_4157, partial [Pseudonocardiales bacterium]|nr:hypothetical protein [Pseudonocardiales bacterium]